MRTVIRHQPSPHTTPSPSSFSRPFCMQTSSTPIDSDFEQLFQLCTHVPVSQMHLDTAIRVTRTFFTSTPACKQWGGAVQSLSQCLARVAHALSSVECKWASEFLHFVRSSISKADVLALLQTISDIVSEAMVAVLYFFMCICSSEAAPDWSILFTGNQSLSHSLDLVAQLLQATLPSTHFTAPRPLQPRHSVPRLILTRSPLRSCSDCSSACHGPWVSSRLV